MDEKVALTPRFITESGTFINMSLFYRSGDVESGYLSIMLDTIIHTRQELINWIRI